MIYSILQFAWWGLCLSAGCAFSSMWWIDDDNNISEKIFGSLAFLFVSIIVAAAVQGFFTWAGNLFH